MAVAAFVFADAGAAGAAQPRVGLGTAASFAVLAGSTVTNTGASVIHGNVGNSPGTAIVGFPPGNILDGVKHDDDTVANQAKSDLVTGYNSAAGRTPRTAVGADLAGRTLLAGVYSSPTLGLTGTVTLNAQGNPAAVFIFQASSTLITASSSVVALTNGASACNVYWQVGSSATLGTDSTFVGTVMALTSITANTRASIEGRLLARNAAVTLDDNLITQPSCTTPTPTPTATPTATTTPSSGTGGSSAGTGAGSAGSGSGTGSGKGGGVPLRTTGTSAKSTAASSTASTSAHTPTVESANRPPVLAKTGSDSAILTEAGAFAIILGALILMLARRRVVTARHRH